MRTTTLVLVIITMSFVVAACSKAQVANSTKQEAIAQATPSNKFTAADVAKLKWIEGTWRGMDGDKPFYERYKLEETAPGKEKDVTVDPSCPDAEIVHCTLS